MNKNNNIILLELQYKRIKIIITTVENDPPINR